MKITPRNLNIFQKALRVLYPDRCPYCFAPIDSGELNCKECEKEKNGITYFVYARGNFPCISPMPYAGVFANGIKAFKFKNRKQCAYQLAFPMAQAVAKSYAEQEFDVISYVPLHKEKQKERGYNQSQLLAKELGKILNIPVKELLVKTRKNKPQHTLKLKERAKNVQGVYKVVDASCVKDKKILLVDDIITTGYTLGECAKMLQKAEATSIHCVTFAVATVKTT